MTTVAQVIARESSSGTSSRWRPITQEVRMPMPVAQADRDREAGDRLREAFGRQAPVLGRGEEEGRDADRQRRGQSELAGQEGKMPVGIATVASRKR